MPRGAHGRGGPAADPTSGRSESGRNAATASKDGWTELPAKPSNTRAPKWPLDLESAAEKALWGVMWRKPQSEMWRKRAMEWQVAAYVRAFLESTAKGAPASMKTAVLRQEDSLGISLVGLQQLRWRIRDDEVAAKRSGPAAVEPEKQAPVRRLRGPSAA